MSHLKPLLYERVANLPSDFSPLSQPAMDYARGVVLCPPDYFDVVDVKNPFMAGMAGTIDRGAARREWEAMREAFARAGAEIVELAPLPGCEDMVFCANTAFLAVDERGAKTCVPSRMTFASRRAEVAPMLAWAASSGYRIAEAGEASLRFEGSGEVEVLVQGQWPKRRLIERFREGAVEGRPGCLLVASASFWEGVDVPGDALQLVIIDKLPFPPPGDPLVEARGQRLESQGRSPFNDYFVPEAAVALKQGAGRLIRRESDRGLLVVCDTRLAQMGYGKRLLAALPPMRRQRDEAEFEEALEQLAAQ